MSAAACRSAAMTTVVLVLLGNPAAVFGDSGADDTGGLPSDPIPLLSRDRSLTDAEVSALEQGLRGQSECDVARLLGQPDAVDRLSDTDVRWRYRFGRDALLLSVRAGRACRVGWVTINREEQERQTGVRDDDLVGFVGP